MCEGRRRRRKEEGQEMSMRVVAVKAPSGLWRRPMTAASAHIRTSAQVYFFLSDAHRMSIICSRRVVVSPYSKEPIGYVVGFCSAASEPRTCCGIAELTHVRDILFYVFAYVYLSMCTGAPE